MAVARILLKFKFVFTYETSLIRYRAFNSQDFMLEMINLDFRLTSEPALDYFVCKTVSIQHPKRDSLN